MWCLRQKALRGECAKVKRHTEGVIFIQIGDMEERIIKLTLEKAKEFYKKGGEFKDLALSAFTEQELTKVESPKTWEEFCHSHPVKRGEYYITTDSWIKEVIRDNERDPQKDINLFSSAKQAEAYLALMQLHQLRDCYRQGWIPNWNDGSVKYYVYISSCGSSIIDKTVNISHFLSFQTKEKAMEFSFNFRNLIIQAGDLL